MKKFTYRGYEYERITTTTQISGYVCSDLDIINRDFPVAKHSDIYNAIDYLLHYRQCAEMQHNHDKEIERIFNT